MFHVVPNWHPALVHFTIALYTTATFLYAVHVVIAKSRWGDAALMAARVNLWLWGPNLDHHCCGRVQAFFTVPHNEAQTPSMIDHRNWALATAIIWWMAAVWEGWRARRNVRGHYLLSVVLVAAMIPLLVTGWKGAELVYRHGVGVMTAGAEAAVITGTNHTSR
jgi:uncharacterized membrane protein